MVFCVRASAMLPPFLAFSGLPVDYLGAISGINSFCVFRYFFYLALRFLDDPSELSTLIYAFR